MTKNAPVRNQHPEMIKAAVRQRGKTMTELALGAGLSESACRMACQKAIPKANKAIASFLRQPLHMLWPKWYDEEGNRLPPERKEPKA